MNEIKWFLLTNQVRKVVVLEVEVAQRQEVGEDRLVDFGQVVVGEVDGVQLVQLGKGPFRNVDDRIVADVQNNDAGLECHRDLVEFKN